jgi:hypothetical protein
MYKSFLDLLIGMATGRSGSWGKTEHSGRENLYLKQVNINKSRKGRGYGAILCVPSVYSDSCTCAFLPSLFELKNQRYWTKKNCWF